MELLYLVCGLIVGVVSTLIVTRMRRAGTLVVWVPDTDDPPYMSIDLDQSIAQIAKQKYVTAKVETHRLNTRV